MYQKLRDLAAPYVMPLEVNGMKGRMLRHPSRDKKNRREILLVYGNHANLERHYGIVRFLARFGTVTLPDLPGFGGMQTFYKIGRNPSIDSYADYLASVIKLRYRGKKITLIGISYGFVVVTRMLQRYPELNSKVEIVVSVVGIADGGDFAVSKFTRVLLESVFLIMRTRPFSWLLQHVVLRPKFVSLFYRKSHPKMQAIDERDRKAFIAYEAYLWRCNHMRTYGVTMHELFNFKHPPIRIPRTVHHVGTEHDHWLDDERVQSELRSIYADMIVYPSSLTNHGGTAYDSEEEARETIPPALLTVLRSKQ